MEKTYAVINHDMKANELRIGNYVRYCDNNYQIQQIIKRNGKYALFCENLYHGVWIDEVEPIVLTEDILLKCKPGYSVHVVGELDVMPYHNGDGTLSLKLGTLGHAYPYEIKYLHHWQNFYYVMEGKELEVQL